LYVPQPGLGNDAAARIAIVNSNVAANFMTPALVGLFKGPKHTFSVGGDQQVQLLTMSGASATR
jgi:predicted Na+-dependent transporter